MGKKIPRIEKQEWFVPRFPLTIFGVLFLAWAYIVLKNHFASFPVILRYLNHVFELKSYPGIEGAERIGVLFSHVGHCLLAGFFILSYYGAGAWLLERIKLKDELTQLEKSILSVSIGTGIMILFTLLTGSMGLLYRWFVLCYTVPCALFGLKTGIVSYREVSGKKKEQRQKYSLFEKSLVAIFVIAALIRIVGALAPETFYDSQHYHLAIPLYWVQNHKISTVPYLWNSYFPMNFHIIYTMVLLFGNDIVAKLVYFFFGFASFWVIFAIGRRWISRKAALLAAVMFYTVPMGIIVSYRAGAEMGLAFFEICTVFALLMYIVSKEGRLKWLVISGANCGLAVGGKYTSVICLFAALGGVITYALLEKYKFRKILKICMVYVTAVLVFGGIWYIRNYVLTGNPVFPQLYGQISSYTGDINVNNVLGNITSDRPMSNISIFRRLLIPWDMNMGKQSEGFSGPVFVLLLPLLLLIGKIPKYMKVLIVYFSIYYLLWLVSAGYFRYFIPGLPVICLILAAYTDALDNKLLLKKILLFIVAIAFLANINFVLRMQKVNNDPLGVVLGLQSRYDYLSSGRPSYPTPYYAGIDWINKNLPENAKILFIGESRALFSERKFVVSGVYNKTPIVEWTKESKTSGELYEKIRKEGITHILFNLGEGVRLMGFEIFYWTDEERKPFDEFWYKYVKPLYKHKMVYVYEIMTEEEASKPHTPPENLVAQIPVYYKKYYK